MILQQEIHKEYKDIYDVYYKYFFILFGLTDRHLPKSEMQMLSFLAVHDNISNTTTRRNYISRFSTTTYTLNNIVSNLTKKSYLVKGEDKKIRLNPVLKSIIGEGKEIPNKVVLKIQMNAEHREESE